MSDAQALFDIIILGNENVGKKNFRNLLVGVSPPENMRQVLELLDDLLLGLASVFFAWLARMLKLGNTFCRNKQFSFGTQTEICFEFFALKIYFLSKF